MPKTRTRTRQVSRLPREQRLSDIMKAGREIFSEKGFEAASMAEIADRAGIVEGTIYRIFKGKRELLEKVVAQWYEEVLADYDVQLAGVRGTWNRLRFMIWYHLQGIHDQPDLFALVAQQLRGRPDYEETEVYALARQYASHATDIIKEGIAAGEFRPDPPMQLVRDMIFGGTEHYAWRFLSGKGDLSVEETADQMANLVYGGLAQGGDAPAPGGLESVVQRLEAVAQKLEQ
ncbi:TetR/AcrR family transcriptional regulator [Pseudomaricurvus alkylphenolicus]|uniref:TetR/AcrR family transcriptional regulator n=1 Tax=Pseudomaricurvus alkylphenolicus TaxID=1306991 RepID=UPI001423C52C|nr:TetR/AcrR family transcriptional regulator [Pseudomaricurvus alkylphenolicus]NIB38049.1 TetR/AcrR family transcriptional regulator [Pseudomaricurvus alkylphenolicus]